MKLMFLFGLLAVVSCPTWAEVTNQESGDVVTLRARDWPAGETLGPAISNPTELQNAQWKPTEITVLVDHAAIRSSSFTGVGFYVAYTREFDVPRPTSQVIREDFFEIPKDQIVWGAERPSIIGRLVVEARFLLWRPVAPSKTRFGETYGVRIKSYARFDSDGSTFRNWETYPDQTMLQDDWKFDRTPQAVALSCSIPFTNL